MIKKDENPKWLKKIKVLVWDLDGTLYHGTSEIRNEIHSNVIKLISKKKKVSLEKAEELFWKKYKKVGSSTKTMMQLGVDDKVIFSGKWYSEAQLKGIKKDEDLILMFKKLANYRHIVNTNGIYSSSVEKLRKLGLALNTFEKIFTNADMFKVLKPDLLPFKEVLKYTGLEPQEHLFIGDRDETDLVPAKKLGMKTCMVWRQSEIADISLDSVYDLTESF